MINILIICKELTNLIKISNSVRRGISNSTCIITTTDSMEALSIIKSKHVKIDLFIVEMQLNNFSGRKLEEFIRSHPLYVNTPVIFISKVSYNLVGFSPLATYQKYKKENYIQLPIESIDVQGKVALYLENIIAKQIEHDLTNKEIQINATTGDVNVKVSEIIFLEIQNKTCTIYTFNKIYKLKRQSLSELVTFINTEDIIRVHRFFAVNLKNLKTIEKADYRNWIANFKNSSLTCPVSKTYIEQLKEKLSTLNYNSI